MSDESFTADTRPPPNRLSIGHLLAWLTLTAVEFAVNAQDGAYYQELLEAIGLENREHVEWRWTLILIISWCSLPFAALGIMGLFWWPLRARKSPASFPVQPGHWLLIASGAYAVADAIMSLFPLGVVLWLGPITFVVLHSLGTGLVVIAPAVLLLVAIFRRPDSKLWTICLGLFAAGLLLRAHGDFAYAFLTSWSMVVHNWFVRLAYGTISLAAVVAAIAIIQDHRCGVRRDLFHSFGAICIIAVLGNLMIDWLVDPYS